MVFNHHRIDAIGFDFRATAFAKSKYIVKPAEFAKQGSRFVVCVSGMIENAGNSADQVLRCLNLNVQDFQDDLGAMGEGDAVDGWLL